MPWTSNADRNVHIHDCTQHVVAGLHQFGHTTYNDLFWYLSICFSSSPPFCLRLRGASGSALLIDTSPALVVPGDYDVVKQDGSDLQVTLVENEPRPRMLSSANSRCQTPRTASFRNRVRSRDRCCVITGNVRRDFSKQDAAHIIPRAHIDQWISAGLSNTLHTSEVSSGINSMQNGLLLDKTIHAIWDSYGVSIHPHTGLITFFSDDPEQQLYDHTPAYLPQPLPTNSPTYPPSTLLEEHFKQCVLANIKGSSGTFLTIDNDSEPDPEDPVIDPLETKLLWELTLADKFGDYDDVGFESDSSLEMKRFILDTKPPHTEMPVETEISSVLCNK